MDAQNKPCAIGKRAAEIVDVRAIGCAYFAKYGSRLGHDFGNTKAIANLDQFAARGDNLVSRGKLSQNKVNSRGIVVDENGVTAYQFLEQQRRVHIALSALACFQVI